MAERTDKEREEKLAQQQEDFARANQGLPPKHAVVSDPEPEALPITERQQEERQAQEFKDAQQATRDENAAARKEQARATPVQRGVSGSTRSPKK